MTGDRRAAVGDSNAVAFIAHLLIALMWATSGLGWSDASSHSHSGGWVGTSRAERHSIVIAVTQLGNGDGTRWPAPAALDRSRRHG
ncbi:hypothetical protein GCM10018954_036610 [Kutzneria kofuensis]